MIAFLTITFAAASVATFLAFMAAIRDGNISASIARNSVLSVPTASKYRADAAQHYREARAYLLTSSTCAVAAIIGALVWTL